MRIELTLLGRFAATIDGQAGKELDISSPRLRALIAYLAMQPDLRETRERLAALLWGDRFDRQARQSLRQALLVLRREFAAAGCQDHLRVDNDTAGFEPAGVLVDAREFLACADSDDPQETARAVDLYAGEFLQGLTLDIETFDTWARDQRARLAAAAATAFERAAWRHDASGDGARAVAVAQRLVDIDRLDEKSQRVLIALLARHRGQNAALQAADVLRQALRSQLGIDPEPATQDLVASIRAAPSAAPLRPATPAPLAVDQAGAAPAPAAVPPPVPTAPENAAPDDPAPRWRPAPQAVMVGGVVSLAILAIAAGALYAWGPWPQARPPGLPQTVTLYDGAWSGSISCAKTSFTRNPLKTTVAIGVQGGIASFSRPVYDPDGSGIAGHETGKGTVAVNGAISIATIWPYPTQRTFTGSYSGYLRDNRGELRGVQTFRYGESGGEERDCTIEISR